MNALKILFVLVLLLFAGGFGFFALTDIPVNQQDMSVEIPRENLLNE